MLGVGTMKLACRASRWSLACADRQHRARVDGPAPAGPFRVRDGW